MAYSREMYGKRCQLNEHGRGLFTRNKERKGIILREAMKGRSWIIKWDGTKTGQQISKHSIEILYGKQN